jgi:pimeloyl-ACP methyl ester carboxylesterase
MARFVLVHGAWQGAWCWREMVPRLVAKGHEAIAIDLPGHGEDRSPVEATILHDYVGCIREAVSASESRTILVGHSAGAIISQAAEFAPDRIQGLVYVAALVPPDRSSMMKFVEALDPAYLATFVWAPDRRTARISPEGARRFLYSNSSPASIEFALQRLTPEPVAPFEAAVHLSDANFGRVPRYYIECLQDRVVPIALQRSMRTSIPFYGVYSIDTDHSPFFSAPEELAAILQKIAEKA